MMTDAERLEIALHRRTVVEQEIREAELLLGLLKKHLKRANSILINDLGQNVVTTLQRKVLSPEERVTINKAWLEGNNATQIAKLIGRRVPVVTRYLSKTGLRPRSSGKGAVYEPIRGSGVDELAGDKEEGSPE